VRTARLKGKIESLKRGCPACQQKLSNPQLPYHRLAPSLSRHHPRGAQRKKLIGIVALAVVALALATALLLPAATWPPRYSAATAKRFGGSGHDGAIEQSERNGRRGRSGHKEPNDLQVALLKSRSVEDAMAARFHLQALYHAKFASSARKRWEKKTFIDNGLKDGLIRLS